MEDTSRSYGTWNSSCKCKCRHPSSRLSHNPSHAHWPRYRHHLKSVELAARKVCQPVDSLPSHLSHLEFDSPNAGTGTSLLPPSPLPHPSTTPVSALFLLYINLSYIRLLPKKAPSAAPPSPKKKKATTKETCCQTVHLTSSLLPPSSFLFWPHFYSGDAPSKRAAYDRQDYYERGHGLGSPPYITTPKEEHRYSDPSNLPLSPLLLSY